MQAMSLELPDDATPLCQHLGATQSQYRHYRFRFRVHPPRLWCCLVVIVVISGVSVLVLLPLLEEPGHHPRLRSRQSGAQRLHLRPATRPPVHQVEGYHQHAFNVLISNRLGKVRPLPDTRNPQCRQQEFVEWSLPTASVVVCFYNEAWSALLRTVHTVLERSPRALLHELILVDDNSTLPELGTRLAQYVASELPSHVRLIRTPAREGLIRARMHGARNASGEVLVFLDSHCEVNVGWLEPLLKRIGSDRRTVACPIIDIINADTFEYSASPIVRGGFNWGLHFKWESPPARARGAHEIDPIP
ncbi:hypothetical protein HPB48_013297 [Haemaphysalis longicornis]|uniref:Glycosyltransferase 2-like domain-containing protein n=1 Tax=Haemaphysalis longicornis TaxID=44386 RepID=A0A9J6G9A1_HAELO|nr:hypothetical protein HPB48_013297 [Haemaphysalis longicornis]